MIRAIIDLALRNRLLVLLLTALVSLVGVVAYDRMPKDIYPDLNAPLVNIITHWEGMASEDVERRVTIPLESLMSGSPHVTRVRSESTTGESIVTVEFDWGIDVYKARQIVAGKLDIVADQLPAGAEDPTMGPVSSRMGEVFEFAVVGDGVDPMLLRSVADWTIKYRLLGVEGVSFVVNLGGFVQQYQVFLKPEMLHHRGITIAEVKEAIEQSNRNFSGGVIRKPNQEFLIKGLGRIESIEHIKNTVITSREGIPVFVKDVADVKVGRMFSAGNAGFDGQEAVSVIVQKQYGGDTLKTIDRVKEFIRDVENDLPPETRIEPYYDQSELINSSLEHVEISMVEGGVLVLVVILLFLGNVRASLIAALTIPISVLFSLVLMYIGGVSLTVMALGGLAIGIGKMASGSVIMVENVYKHLQGGEGDASSLDLTAQGAKEVGPYLFSANLIIILVFLPLLTLEGIGGRMFRPTVYALVAALLGSLIMNITLKPVLMSLCIRSTKRVRRKNRVIEFATRIYVGVLKLSFRLKAIVLLAALAVVVVAGWCYQDLGSEFVPFMDEGSIVASTVMLPETSLHESVRVGKTFEKAFMSFPEVEHVCRTTGMAEESEHVHPVNHSHYLLKLRPRQEGDRGYAELTDAMREKLDLMPGKTPYMFEQPIGNKLAEMLTGTEGQISLKVYGPDLEKLDEKARRIAEIIRDIPGIADLQVEQTSGIPLRVITLKREELARHGIKVDEVADVIETALGGVEVTDVTEVDRMTAVLLRLPERYRQDVDSVKNLLVDTPAGHRVPLEQIADIDPTETGPQTIFRESRSRRKTILCNVVGRDVGRFVEEATAKINESGLFPRGEGYSFKFGGEFESQQRTMQQLKWMMLIVGLSVLVVLFASLHSLRQSLLLLLNIPMTLAGGIIALFLVGQTLNVSSVIGFIALFGIALQNGVVLVGKINDLRRSGVELHDAVIQGAAYRFRPILMTELILILGVLPLALGTTAGSELHRPLAVVYIGGFVVAIFFEQIVLPILYEFSARLGKERFVNEKAA
ncbi:MAG: efflux RND transporter permease subunit [Planctomycetes bacterium]|nr:efflux RND transporter permease subunit [Planctomycetota bacterium]MBL7044267.1 efflux RND transporter permease subunit [Pirellulaceae bacterium]